MRMGKWLMGTVVALVVLIVLAPVVGLTQVQEPQSLEGEVGVEKEGDEAAEPVGSLADFDGDGYADLAIGVPFEWVGSTVEAGAVNVLFGSDSSGLTATGNQYWIQGISVVDSPEAGDTFGTALGAGDFDGDGYTDLAVGVPNEDIGTASDAGAVHVLYGAVSGLIATRDQLWSQASSGIEGSAEDWDRFGGVLAIGDFDGDGYDDLAIGVRAEVIGGLTSVGCVNIIYGSVSGLIAAGNQLWYQDSTGIQGEAEAGDVFGDALAAGDFDRDGYDDLAIGVPGEDVGTVANAGSVNVIYGSSDGLTDVGNWWFYQDTSGILGASEASDSFGYALAVGDFDGDGYTDLAVGVPNEDMGGMDAVGVVNVVFGSSDGLTETGNQLWHQDVSGTENAAEGEDRFGRALTAGDFDADGYDDLAVGIPYEDNGTTLDTGAVHVFYGADGGLTAERDWWFIQNSTGILDSAEVSDHFGMALASGDFDGDSYADLAIGVPHEDIETISAAGAVNVVYGSASGLTPVGDQFWHQDVDGVLNAAEQDDRFGMALAAIPPQRHKVYLPLVLRQ